MTTPDEQPQERPANGHQPGSYGEIAPGVPRYGQYAPEGWVPPSAAPSGSNDAGASHGAYPNPVYPGFQGGPGPIATQTHYAAPKQVVVACRLITIAGAFQAVSGLLLLLVLMLPSVRASMIDTLKAALPNDPAYASMLADDSMISSLLVSAAVISLVAAAIYFWLAAKIRRGANWARTTALVLACISLLALVQPNIFTIIQIGLGAGAMIVLYRSPAKEYFAQRNPGGGPRGY
ncbi:hypothetical protein [Arthrobacter sp. GMC3]|uniref:hypothetical protein n=1 Tax=Arthrobacter sp. GMC3 TaxID=2058894 RepID=UPI000CE50226|nr:hypothetical protein [Arthrobacter sp. GMC3]